MSDGQMLADVGWTGRLFAGLAPASRTQRESEEKQTPKRNGIGERHERRDLAQLIPAVASAHTFYLIFLYLLSPQPLSYSFIEL